MSANDWLIQQKLNLAKGLLESTVQKPIEPGSRACSMEWIAGQSGFVNAITMRHHFRKVLGVSPTQYQEQFAGA
ncbi:MAG: hypothetical protein Q8L06_03840 [Pseudohongiella sp.]|nr:hypothetical protein [Pseudohongiella sp.]